MAPFVREPKPALYNETVCEEAGAASIALYRERWEPSPEAFVLEGVDSSNFSKHEWRRILKRAGIGHRRPKDLRDTFASQLLRAGVQLGYVSQ
ncbi:MAG: hypothetical protein ABFS46_12495 [Myxococcota bacterium]